MVILSTASGNSRTMEMGTPKTEVTAKATAKHVGGKVVAGAKATVKAAPIVAKFALNAGLFAASAYLNPVGTALVAINAVVKCGVDAVESMRSWAMWDKKLTETECAASIQRYLHTTETLEIIKLTAMIGETALLDDENDFNRLDPLLENTQRMCDTVSMARATAFSTAERKCTDKAAVRAAFMIADIELGAMDCDQLFADVAVSKLSKLAGTKKDQPETETIDPLARQQMEQIHGVGLSSNVQLMFEAAKANAFTGDVTTANIVNMLMKRSKENLGLNPDGANKFEIMIPIVAGTDINIKRLIGEKAVEFAKYLKTAQIDGFVGGAKVGDAITKLVAGGVDGLPAFGQTIATYSGENIQGSVSKNLQQNVLQPILQKVVASSGGQLVALLPESLSSMVKAKLGGASGLLSGVLGKLLTKSIKGKAADLSKTILEYFLKNDVKKSEGMFKNSMCEYYRNEADNDVKINNFLTFVFRFITTQQGNPDSAMRQPMTLPRESCKILFQGTEGSSSEEDAQKACDSFYSNDVQDNTNDNVNTRMKDIIGLLAARYTDGLSFDFSKCNTEMCLSNIKEGESFSSCRVLCNHASAVSSMNFPGENWYTMITIGDSLNMFVRAAAKARETETRTIFDGIDKYCNNPKSLRMEYEKTRHVGLVADSDPKVAEMLAMKPSGGQCTAASFLTAQGIVKTIANVVMSDYKAAETWATANCGGKDTERPNKITELKPARTILGIVQEALNRDRKRAVDDKKKWTDADCKYNFQKVGKCMNEAHCQYQPKLWDMRLDTSCRVRPGTTGDFEAEHKDKDCTWDYKVGMCMPHRYCNRQYQFGDMHLGQSCRKRKNMPPPIKTCNKCDFEEKPIGQDYENCIATMYAQERIAPAITSYCSKLGAPKDVKAKCDEFGIYLTSRLVLIGEGGESYNNLMTKETGVYGYEVMFSEYAFATIPGAKAEFYGRSADIGSMAQLANYDDIPEAVLARTLSTMSMRHGMKEVFETINGEVLNIIANWQTYKMGDDPRYKRLHDLLNNDKIREGIMKDLVDLKRGIPKNIYFRSNIAWGEKRKTDLHKFFTAALETIEIQRVIDAVSIASNSKDNSSPLKSELNNFELDCTFTDVQYFQMLTRVEFEYETGIKQRTTARVVTRMLEAFRHSLKTRQSSPPTGFLELNGSPAKPEKRAAPTNVVPMHEMNSEGRIFTPYHVLYGGTKNWLRLRSLPEFSFLNVVYKQSTYPYNHGKMPYDEFFKASDLEATCADPNAPPEAMTGGGVKPQEGTVASKKDGNGGGTGGVEDDLSFIERGFVGTKKEKKTDQQGTLQPEKEPVSSEEEEEAEDMVTPMEEKDCKWDGRQARCVPLNSCEFVPQSTDFSMTQRCRNKKNITAVEKPKPDKPKEGKSWFTWTKDPKMDGKCCLYGSTCFRCQHGSKYVRPHVCASSRKCKVAEVEPTDSSEQLTDNDCTWSVPKATCVTADDRQKEGVCSWQFRWGDRTLRQSCRPNDKGIVRYDNSGADVDPNLPPQSDKGCFWSYSLDICMPKEHCKRKFKWGDTHLGQSCRLKKEYEKNTLESDRAIGEAINLVNCGLRSVVEGSPDQGMDIYRICSSGSWELSSESCPDGKTCSNAPEKVCQAKGFGWDTKFLKNNHGKPLDIKFSVPMSFKRSETRAGEYHFISLSTPQKTALENTLSTGGLPANELTNEKKALCEICQLQFHEKVSDRRMKNNDYEYDSDICKKACDHFMTSGRRTCYQSCERMLSKQRDPMGSSLDIFDKICIKSKSTLSPKTLTDLRSKSNQGKRFLDCSPTMAKKFLWKFAPTNFILKNALSIAKKKGTANVDIQFAGFKGVKKGTLLKQYLMAIKYENKDLKIESTMDPCDMSHLGYCPYFYKPVEHLFAHDLKKKYADEAAKKKLENLSEEEKIKIKAEKEVQKLKAGMEASEKK